jgi:hypothetical protein
LAVLGERALNRAVLARQHLLERTDLPLPAALEAIAGIQAQYAPSMYVGLWSRLAGLERGALTAALEERRVVQATLMRMTIHLVSPADYWPFALATREARRTLWLRARKDAPPEAEMVAGARHLRAALTGGKALRRTEVEALLGKVRAHGIGLWLDLVRVPPSGTWERRRADLFGLAEEWVGPEPPATDAAAHLVRRYLAGFGPATRKDIASFTGLKLTALKPSLETLALERHESEAGEELLDVPGAPLPDAKTPAPVRFLPTWDATLLVHCRRAGIVREEHRPILFHTKNPQSVPVFTVDGVVAGTWRHADGAIAIEPFASLDRATGAALDVEAARLAAFHA